MITKTIANTSMFKASKLTNEWLGQVHILLDEMYGPHSKECTYLVESPFDQEDFDVLRMTGWEPRGSFAYRRFGTLINKWYSYYHTEHYNIFTGERVHEFGYKFNSDTDAVHFKLAIG
jgi:hypothetical protein